MNMPLSKRQLVLFLFVITALPYVNSPGFSFGQIVNANIVNITNDSGTNSINFDDTTNGVGAEFSVFHSTEFFEIDNAASVGVFGISDTAGTDTLTLRDTGVGIGTFSPASELHLRGGAGTPFTESRILVENVGADAKDRTLVELQNNGAVVMNFLDTSQAGSTPFSIRANEAKFAIQKVGGPVRAGMSIFGDGNIRYSVNGIPNITVKPDGTVNVIGQPGGGNLNVIGPSGGAGNLFVKGNIKYNGTLTGPSDRDLKENFTAIDPQEILARVASLPITKWNYKADENDTPHLGPMAQDFAASFGLGDDDKRIPLMDSDGVALAAIQGLHQVVEAKEREIEQLNQSLRAQQDLVARQTEMIADLADRLEKLEALAARPNN